MNHKIDMGEAQIIKAQEDLKQMFRGSPSQEIGRAIKPAPFFRMKKSILLKDCIGLNPVQRLIAVAIYSYYYPKLGYSIISISKMKKITGAGETTLYKNLPKVLKHLGIRKDKTIGKVNHFFF